MSMMRILAAGLLALSMAGCLGQASEDAGSQPSPFTPPPANQAPSIGSLPAQNTVTAGTALSLQPSASDPDNDPLTFEVANKPGWASFDANSGRLWGTPGAANVGTYSNIRISVRDAAHVTAGNAFSIVVNAASTPPPANRSPVISGTPAPSVTEGASYSFTPTASDPDGNALTFSITGRPAWASFDTANGRLSGTPGAGSAGAYANIQISVSDGSLSATLAAFTITVLPANRAPVISGSPATTGREGIAWSFQPTASDPDGNALSFSIANRPAWATFNAGTGRLSGTPPAGSAGTYSGIVVSVSDGAASASLPAFSIAVAANRAPVIGGTPAATVTAGQAYSFTPTASDPDGNALGFSIVNRPAWATFNTGTGRLSGTPTQAQAAQYVDIRITVSDGMASATLPAFTITVETGNRAPTISGSPATSIVEGQAYSFTPTASDADGDTLSFTITNRPSWATFNTSTGRLSGTPGAGTVGTYSNIQIRVSDGTVEAALPAFSITVQQAANGSATLSWNAPTTRTDGSPLTNLAGYRLRYGNSSGNYPNTITISNPGLTSYVVNNLASGTWFFVLAAYDSGGLESSNTNPVSKTIP
ncbi:MAG TPA: putative Ig domain-containing protein [Steroidobacteraceae bacterium]